VRNLDTVSTYFKTTVLRFREWRWAFLLALAVLLYIQKRNDLVSTSLKTSEPDGELADGVLHAVVNIRM
jgi:hypothetical protein